MDGGLKGWNTNKTFKNLGGIFSVLLEAAEFQQGYGSVWGSGIICIFSLTLESLQFQKRNSLKQERLSQDNPQEFKIQNVE